MIMLLRSNVSGDIKSKNNNCGFTVIELLVALVISGVVMAGVIQLFAIQVKTHNAQFAVSSLQQNMRSSMDYMIRFARMSGYDPGFVGAGFQSALANSLDFTRDVGTLSGGAVDTTPNGIIDDHWDEKIIFRLNSSSGRLERVKANGTPVLVADNIEALNFRYLDSLGNDTSTVTDIRSVQITMVGRTSPLSGIMPRFTNTTTYRNQRGDTLLPAQNDSVRRMMLTAEVRCRNLNR